MHLRNEFHHSGFNALLPALRRTESAELAIQLDVFEEEMADDWSELLHRFHDVQFDLRDEGDCFQFVRNTVKGTAAEPYFLSILQHLLLIRDDHLYRCIAGVFFFCALWV